MYKSWMWKQRSYREQFQEHQSGGGAGDSAVVDDQQQAEQQASGDDPDAEQQAADEVDPQAAAEEEVVFSFGDEPAPKSEEEELELSPVANTAWAKMRKEKQDLKQRVRELEQAEAARQAAAAPKVEDVGAEPDLSDDDVNFDPDTFKQKWKGWNDRKQAADQKAAAARQAQEAEQAAWNSKLTAYKAAGAALKTSGFEDAESVVLSTLNPTQQAILLEGPDTAEASAQLVAALGRNPVKLKALAEIKSAVKYTVAVARLMDQLKATPIKQPPAPETQVRSTAGKVTAIDSTEARLEEQADKTGNRTALIAYRKQKAAKAA